MSLKDRLIDALRLPESRTITDLDDPSATVVHAQIIRRKKFLSEVYRDFYGRLKNALGPIGAGAVIVELGSGGGFIKEVIPSVITSDVLSVPNVDLRFSGQRMPFGDTSVDAFLMFDVFHHIKDPRGFLRELDRTLKPGGRILMIEPSNTVWGRFINTNFHHEAFDPSSGWEIDGEGPMSHANGALPWIVFSRDRALFEREFPSLRLATLEPHTPFKYLLSGGVSLQQLLPNALYPAVHGLEWLLSPLNRWLGMFYFVAIRKQAVA